MIRKPLPKDVYSEKIYWYHLSSTLKKKRIVLKPRTNDEGFNRGDGEPNTKRICVSPSLEQCLTAIPYNKCDALSIYRTCRKIMVKKPTPYDVFDVAVTEEGWITRPIIFIRVGVFCLDNIVDKNNKRIKIKTEAASIGDCEWSEDLCKWWRKLDPWRFVDNCA